MSTETILIGLATGFSTGMLSGLLGIGGSGILVVAAVSFMGLAQHSAQAAAIAATVPIAIIGVINLHRKRLVNYQVAMYLAVGIAVGGAIGAYIANVTPGPILKKLFSAFFGLMSLQMLWGSRRDKGDPANSNTNN
ncbi:hypothetical protein AXX12_01230 [Anaerosporomusa subterranea]|uniref:Probable membrane transporter protein n=1 Tax=Anaerosporomusa subterranea TaxID=1794912 RepID=A0A154BW76_ANASB|nr:sulfite exporter TauE/SafE family protein [Anaerosporomusa subterranea]KYZ78196.1 hypothetical protein AXX12_01230 [Anaerosporomusa subterranea]